MEDLIAEEDMVVTVSHDGYVKRTSTANWAQRRGGEETGSEAKSRT